MMHVKDLNLDEDIISLFNYTNNEYAEASLIKMLKPTNMSQAAVVERQEICRGLMQQWNALEHFSYPVLYLKETYRFLIDVTHGTVVLDEPTLKAKLRLHLSEGERSQTRSQLVQTWLFFDGIYGKCLARVDRQQFPASYGQQLEKNVLFLRKFRLAYFTEAINEDKFSVSRMVEAMQLLASLDEREITLFWEFFFQFEAYHAIAKAIRKHQFTFPTFTKREFQIDDFYHPLVEKPVKNSLRLQPGENTVLLTGPNMSGKSTLLKSVGLCVYLAHVGVAVPAASCSLPYFDTVVIAINVKDDLQRGYSHFMAEVRNLKNVLQQASEGKKCFAVFDELFKGTNIDDAQEITLSTINGLAKFSNSLFFISTHLLHLEEQITRQPGNIIKCFIECRLEEGLPTFTYRLLPGWSTVKIGKILFEAEGLTKLLE